MDYVTLCMHKYLYQLSVQVQPRCRSFRDDFSHGKRLEYNCNLSFVMVIT